VSLPLFVRQSRVTSCKYALRELRVAVLAVISQAVACGLYKYALRELRVAVLAVISQAVACHLCTYVGML
jgi:hypothetical protein